MYTRIFTQHEMSCAAGQLPLELVADDSVYEYDKVHLPDGAWRPTGWFSEWVSGLDVFDVEREMSPYRDALAGVQEDWLRRSTSGLPGITSV